MRSQKARAPSSDPSARHELQLVLATFLIFLVLLQCETLDFRNVMAWISEYSIRKKLEKPIFQKSASGLDRPVRGGGQAAPKAGGRS